MTKQEKTKPHGHTGKRGVQVNNWKDGRFVSNGYLYVYKPDHPNSNNRRYVLESRFIMSEIINRPLLKNEIVHHKDGNNLNNNPENLLLTTRKGHPSIHRNSPFTATCHNCNEIFVLKRKTRFDKNFCSRPCYLSWRSYSH